MRGSERRTRAGAKKLGCGRSDQAVIITATAYELSALLSFLFHLFLEQHLRHSQKRRRKTLLEAQLKVSHSAAADPPFNSSPCSPLSSPVSSPTGSCPLCPLTPVCRRHCRGVSSLSCFVVSSDISSNKGNWTGTRSKQASSRAH